MIISSHTNIVTQSQSYETEGSVPMIIMAGHAVW